MYFTHYSFMMVKKHSEHTAHSIPYNIICSKKNHCVLVLLDSLLSMPYMKLCTVIKNYFFFCNSLQ